MVVRVSLQALRAGDRLLALCMRLRAPVVFCVWWLSSMPCGLRDVCAPSPVCSVVALLLLFFEIEGPAGRAGRDRRWERRDRWIDSNRRGRRRRCRRGAGEVRQGEG